jgi:predicted metal-dependent hydrolase
MRTKRRKRLQTADELKAAVGNWAAKIKARPKQIRIQRMPRKWASCSSKGRVTFNSELFRQSYGFQEFVIVHELLHLKIPNHGKLFKSLLKAYLSTSGDRTKLTIARLRGVDSSSSARNGRDAHCRH